MLCFINSAWIFYVIFEKEERFSCYVKGNAENFF